MSSEKAAKETNGTRLYGWIVAVGVLCVAGIGLVLAFAPEQAPLLGTLITGFGLALIGQLFNAQKLSQIESKAVETAGATAATDDKVIAMGKQLDGRLEELLKTTKEAYFAKGQVVEKEKAAAEATEAAAPVAVVNVAEMKVDAGKVSIEQKKPPID